MTSARRFFPSPMTAPPFDISIWMERVSNGETRHLKAVIPLPTEVAPPFRATWSARHDHLALMGQPGDGWRTGNRPWEFGWRRHCWRPYLPLAPLGDWES